MAELQRMVSSKLGGKTCILTTQRYDAPLGKVWGNVFATLSVELDGIRDQKWNSKRMIIFQSVILQHAQAINNAKHICARIQFQIDCWNRGVFGKIVKNTFNADTGFMGKARRNQSKEQHHHTLSNIIPKGKLRKEVRFVCE